MEKIRVAVLFGGKSGEHEVSLRSAASVLRALDRKKYSVIPIGITKQGQWRCNPNFQEEAFAQILESGVSVCLPAEPAGHQIIQTRLEREWIGNKTSIDVVFPVLHGPYGEDGTLQGLLEMANIAYVGAGVLGSSVGMDKDVMKRLLKEAQIPGVEFITFLDRKWQKHPQQIRDEIEERLGFPCFVKPANLGSSVGISKVKVPQGLPSAIDLACQYDRKVIVEQGIDGREIECSVLGNDEPIASLPGEIIPSREFYDYEAKYIDENSQLLIPAPLSTNQVNQVQELAIKTFQVTECAGMARVDFFLDRKTNGVLVNEINTIPGFTSISMYPKLWEATGIGYPELIDRLIQLALERHRAKQAKKTSYE